VQNDRFDRRIIAKLFQLANHRLGRQYHALEIDHADTIAESPEASFPGSCVKREINQREHRQHEEEECSAANQYPEQCARTSFRHGESVAPETSGISCAGTDDLQGRTFNPDLNRSTADKLPIRIDIDGKFCFDTCTGGLEVIYLANPQMLTAVNGWEQSKEPQRPNRTDKTHIE
jgi:hypothetical protein